MIFHHDFQMATGIESFLSNRNTIRPLKRGGHIEMQA